MLFLFGVTACSWGRIEGGVFYSPKGYRVNLPAGAWRASTGGRADLVLTRVGSEGGILVHATCEGNPPGRPLPVLARHLTFGLEERTPLQREAVRVAGRPAIRMLVEGRLDGVPVTVEGFVLKGKECVYDLLYAAPPADFAAGRGKFRELVGSFAGP